MSQPHVVIVVLNWNGREDTLACLRSLRACTYPHHRVLVVDNGSQDGSEQAIRTAYPDLPVLQTGSNLGFAGGNNAGIDWALRQGADWVLLLNNDTEVEPGFLSEMVACAQQDARTGVVGAAIAYASQPRRLWAYGGGRFNVATGRVRHVQVPLPQAQLRPRGTVHFYVTGCAMLLRSEMLQQVGVLDTGYFHFCEDVDLCLRAAAAGWEIAVAADARLVHKVSATTRVSSPLFLYYNLRSRLRLVARFGPPGAPGRLALALLWLRLWRPAAQSGMGVVGWKALRRALRDFQAGVQGPAPAEWATWRKSRPTGESAGNAGRVGVWACAAGLLAAACAGLPALSGCVHDEEHAGPANSAPASSAPAAPSSPATAASDGGEGRGRSGMEDLGTHLRALWGDADPPPARIEDLLWRMAQDGARANQVVARADSTHRALTDTLLAVLRWGEPRARASLPDLYVVHDFGPPPGQRPPSWHDLRRQGLRLLPRIALDSQRASDVLLRSRLDPLPPGERRSPSVLGGQVALWEQWWSERGMDPRYYLDPAGIPDVAGWVALLRNGPGDPARRAPASVDDERAVKALQSPLGQLLLPLADDGLRRRAVLEALSPERDQHLVAEAMAIAGLYQEEFTRAGVPRRTWDPKAGKPAGYHSADLRGVALGVLDRVAGRVASGADEEAVILDWLRWWARARFQARFYRDAREAPSLAPLLEGLDRVTAQGGRPFAPFLRQVILATSHRDLLLDRWVASGGRANVAEAVEWLQMDRATAIAAGFVPLRTVLPLRPLPGDPGQPAAIPWETAQEVLREMLRWATGEVGLPEEGVEPVVRDSFWAQWWDVHRTEPQWHRRGAQPPPPRFAPARARTG